MTSEVKAPISGGATTAPSSSSSSIPVVSGGAALLAVLAAGAVMVILADPFPTLVDGLLILILVGAILQTSGTWLPWASAAASSFKVG